MSSAAASVPPPPPRAAEPSMEEILASIRKIISEDQKVLEARADAARTPEPGHAESAAGADPEAGEDDEDVLELPASAMRPHESAEDVVPAAVSAAPVQPEPAAAPVFVAPVSVAPVSAAPAVERPARPAQAALPPVPPLLSDASAGAAGAAFQSLANAVFTQNARTMDDLVKDMLRPMLKSWLDEHLPALVERLVRAEIERVSRGGR